MSERDDLTQRIVDYMKTRNTPFTDWEEAAREACRLLLTEARWDALRAMGGTYHESMDYWTVPD